MSTRTGTPSRASARCSSATDAVQHVHLVAAGRGAEGGCASARPPSAPRPAATRCTCCTASVADEQRALARDGVPVRVLISYGTHWFPWYMRRLAERPANVWFVIRNLV